MCRVVGPVASLLAGQDGVSLAHPEAVLLVDHCHSQVSKAHALLDQSMGAHDNVHFARFQRLAHALRSPADWLPFSRPHSYAEGLQLTDRARCSADRPAPQWAP